MSQPEPERRYVVYVSPRLGEVVVIRADISHAEASLIVAQQAAREKQVRTMRNQQRRVRYAMRRGVDYTPRFTNFRKDPIPLAQLPTYLDKLQAKFAARFGTSLYRLDPARPYTPIKYQMVPMHELKPLL